ncbi:hypothetical protein L227DRAFT_126325 [Lentinus tigrinus ALCF2SS1-6]|uniref:Uncharacterized protein n=1 Tax=Lentinus tigrinus ALCF2SS1-6 TaxID=1328759 RepID=A0A5C2SRE9_9APHY|nr:hypothetical protein L227DRAFT_126325 [Lentinus tigrinus ALCF2SS1-6]
MYSQPLAPPERMRTVNDKVPPPIEGAVRILVEVMSRSTVRPRSRAWSCSSGHTSVTVARLPHSPAHLLLARTRTAWPSLELCVQVHENRNSQAYVSMGCDAMWHRNQRRTLSSLAPVPAPQLLRSQGGRQMQVTLHSVLSVPREATFGSTSASAD